MPLFGAIINDFRKHVAEKLNEEAELKAQHPEFHYCRCVKCGASLCKETDSYRFTADGKPICYDCAED